MAYSSHEKTASSSSSSYTDPSIVPESSVKASLSGSYSPSFRALGGPNMDLMRSILIMPPDLLPVRGPRRSPVLELDVPRSRQKEQRK